MGEVRKPVRVLFVCLGNICRSPMAEGVFRHLVQQAGLQGQIQADSAGTGAWHVGEPPHNGTRRILQQHGISYQHAARVVTRDDFQHFHYLVAMDSDNLYNLQRMAPANVQPRLLMEYASNATRLEVPDPYYTGGFAEVYDLVTQGSQGLLAHIIKTERLSV